MADIAGKYGSLQSRSSYQSLKHPQLTLREAGFLVELSHPNIITLEGLVESVSNNMIWLVFPWEEQGNMRDFIASEDWEIPERISLVRSSYFSSTRF